MNDLKNYHVSENDLYASYLSLEQHHIETLEIDQRKLSRNLNGHNFSLGFPIQVHNISRRSKLNNGCSREIQIVVTFYTEVRFRCIIYRDARN